MAAPAAFVMCGDVQAPVLTERKPRRGWAVLFVWQPLDIRPRLNPQRFGWSLERTKLLTLGSPKGVLLQLQVWRRKPLIVAPGRGEVPTWL